MATKKRTRHIGVRTTEALQDIGTTLQMVQSGFINDAEFYELFNWERTRLGLRPWTKVQFDKTIIEPARLKALENQKLAMAQAKNDTKRKKQMDAQNDRQVRIKELEQESRIKTLEGDVLKKEKELTILREAIGKTLVLEQA